MFIFDFNRKDRETAKKFADSQINKEIDEALAAPSTEYVYPAEVCPGVIKRTQELSVLLTL